MATKHKKLPLFIGFQAMDLDAATGDLKLLFLGQDNRHYHLRLAHGIVPMLTTSLIGMARKSWEAGADPQSRQEAVQSLTLTGVSPLTSSTGEPGLLLALEGQLPFPLIFGQPILKKLQIALESLAADKRPPDTHSQH